jgi:uncharacterized protein DUF992
MKPLTRFLGHTKEGSTFRLAGSATIAAATVLLLEVHSARAQPRIQVGTLACSVGPSVGALIASRRRINCRFIRTNGPPETYSGAITRFGLDVGITTGGVMRWRVVARTRALGRGAIAGTYVGASGDVSLGVGVGANVLIGGSRRSVMLQPVSTVGKVGVNLAVGVAGLTLRFKG